MFALLLGATELSAQAEERPPELVRASVEFAAPPSCGSRADLIARITRRSERIRFEPDGAPRALEVTLVRAGDALVATLVLKQPSGRRSSRTLRASSCDEALEAVALVAAVSLDPTASTAPERELPPAPPPAPPPTLPPPAPRAEPPAPRSAAEAPSPGAETLGVSAALLGQVSWGPAPSGLPGLGVALGLELDTGSLFSPVARVSFVHSRGGGFRPETGAGEAAFELSQATLELCPVRLGTNRAAAYPCPFASGGRLLSEGSGALDSQSHGRPWWVIGGGVLALFRPVGVLELAVSASAGIPLIRDTFQFEPEEPGHVVHEVPAAVLVLGLAVGVAFP